MARPRTRSDDDIFAGLGRVIAANGPDFALTDLAAEVGLTPAALVQRFGSKRALLLRYVDSFYGGLEGQVERSRRRHGAPLDTLVGLLCDLASGFRSREQAANSVAFLYVDLTDPEFRAPFLAWSQRVLEVVRGLLNDAVRDDSLRPGDNACRARVIWAVYNGALLTWTLDGRGRSARWMKDHLEAVIEPLRV